MLASITRIFSSYFPPETNFDLLLPFTDFLTVTHFLTICLLCLYSDFDLHSDDLTAAYTYSSLCLFLDHPPYQHQIKFLCSLYSIYVISQQIHIISVKPEADVSHLVSDSLGFPGHS
jgi:hypothetical protein